MDLSALLAREGIQADDADVLVAWARQRAAALVARIEPGSALAQQLGATLEQARSQPDGVAADVPVPLTRPTSRGSSRPGRSVSRPYLGAAVQAALSRNEPALERVLETAEVAVEDAPAPTPAAAPAPAPAPVSAEPEDEDASIGGFNRFAFSVRRRAMETREDNEDSNSPTLTRGFELHAEESTSSGAWQVSDLDLPAPPGFETRAGQDVPADRSDDAEASGGLVVGIPDEEGIDIPVPRARPRSESRGVATASPAPSGPHPEPQAARSSEVLELDSGTLALESLDIDIPEPLAPPAPPARETTRPQSMAQLSSGPQRSAPPPPPPGRSGPHARASEAAPPSGPLARAPSAPQAAASRAPSAPQSASRPPSAPPAPSAAAAKSSPRGRTKTTTAEQKQVKAAPEPKPAATKRGKGRKKIVELGQPVAAPHEPAMAAPRKHSIGNHVPTSEPSTAGRDIPAYLQDDDE